MRLPRTKTLTDPRLTSLDPQVRAVLADLTKQIQKQQNGNHRQGKKRKFKATRAVAKGVGWSARKAHARRRPLLPIYVAVLLLVLGVILNHVPQGWRSALLFIALTAAAEAGVLAIRRKYYKPRPPLSVLRWKVPAAHYLHAVLGVASLWLLVASIVGPNHKPMPLLLLAATVAGGLPWWWKHRSRHTEPVQADDRRTRWDERVAGTGGALAESHLTDISDASTGWVATIVLPGGKLTTAQATNTDTRRRIASAYGLPVASVVVEPTIGAEEDRARLIVMSKRNPLHDVQKFTGPTLDKASGWATIGVYPDGEPARWRVFVPNSGACHGFIVGTTGSGKSGLINDLLAEYRHSGLAVIFLADPEDGESVPDWQDDVHWFAGTLDEIRRMLQAAERIMIDRKARRKWMRWTDAKGRTRRGRGYHNPTPDDPIIVCIVDESPDVLADRECRRIIAWIGKKGRKLGVAVIPAVQVPSLNELGGDLTVRSMISAFNVAIFRTSDAYSKQMAVPGELEIDPASLPPFWPDGSPTAGLGYLTAAGTSRLSPFRGNFLEDPYDWATSGEPAELAGRDLEAAGEDYLTWRERRDADPDDLPATSVPAQPVPFLKTIPDGPDRRTVAERIIGYLASVEEATRDMVAVNAGISGSHASNELKKLAKDGRVVDLRHGLWGIGSATVDPTEDVISLEEARLSRK